MTHWDFFTSSSTFLEATAKLAKESCGKHGYATEKAAKRKMKEIRKRRSSTTRRKFGKFETRAYQCPTCSLWHLTSHEFED